MRFSEDTSDTRVISLSMVYQSLEVGNTGKEPQRRRSLSLTFRAYKIFWAFWFVVRRVEG
jgi:hypothetical protein